MKLRRDNYLAMDPINEEELLKLLRSPRTPANLFRRARAVVLLAQNFNPTEAARRSGLHRSNVYRWAKRFFDDGVSGLRDMPRRRKSRSDTVAMPKFECAIPPVESPIAALSQQNQGNKMMVGSE